MEKQRVNKGLFIPHPLLLDLSLTSGASGTYSYISVDKTRKRWVSVMFLVVTTEVSAKHADFFSFMQIKKQNNSTEFSNKIK